MSSNRDLREWLDEWPYDPENNARVVQATDGRQVLQVRLPMGIEQYELEGRPDGLRPHEKESALEFHLGRLTEARAAGREAEFTLDPEACAELFQEGVLYYQRYLSLFQLKDWPRVARDTTRNLRLFDFVNRYAEREEDQLQLEQWRPYITRMNAVARAMIELEKARPEQARKIVREAIDTIESLPGMDNPTFRFERERSLTVLRELDEQIAKTRPVSQIEQLEHDLRKAVEAQEFERAAELRDRIRELRKKDGVAQ